jgi:iron only hydrogenase large subunit-like protein
MATDGIANVDAVLTTRELAQMIREAGIDFIHLPDELFDSPWACRPAPRTFSA